ALGRLALALRAEQEHRRDVAAQLAGPRATARVLFLLPAFGLLLGQLLGAAPVRFLLESPLGLLCAVAGTVLDVWVWCGRPGWCVRPSRRRDRGGAGRGRRRGHSAGRGDATVGLHGPARSHTRD